MRRSFPIQLTLLVFALAALWATGDIFAQTPLRGVNLAYNFDDFYMPESDAKKIKELGYGLMISNVDLWLNSPRSWAHFDGTIKLADVLMCARDEGNSRNLSPDNVNYRRLYRFDWSDLLRPDGSVIFFENNIIRIINPTDSNQVSLPNTSWWNYAHGRNIQQVLESAPTLHPVDGVWGDDTFGRPFFGSLDYNRDRTADNPEPLWGEGVKTMMSNTRLSIGPRKIIVLNGRDIPVGFFPDSSANGRNIERVWDNFGEFSTPHAMIAHLRDWLVNGRAPQICILFPNSGAYNDVLFAASCALVLGRQTYLAYSSIAWPADIAKIFLAQLGDEIVKGAVWDILRNGDVLSREYSGGRVLLNLGSRSQAITLGKKFFTLDSVLVETVTLTPISGIILLNAEPTTVDESEPSTDIPTDYVLEQNYPNPFNPETTIRFALPKTGQVRLVIYDLLGQKVRTLVEGMQQTARHSMVWDGRDELGEQVPSGVYFYRLEAGGEVRMRRMTLLR